MVWLSETYILSPALFLNVIVIFIYRLGYIYNEVKLNTVLLLTRARPQSEGLSIRSIDLHLGLTMRRV